MAQMGNGCCRFYTVRGFPEDSELGDKKVIAWLGGKTYVVEAEGGGRCILKMYAYEEIRILRQLWTSAHREGIDFWYISPEVRATHEDKFMYKECDTTLQAEADRGGLTMEMVLRICEVLVSHVTVLARLGWIHLRLDPNNVGLVWTGGQWYPLLTNFAHAQRIHERVLPAKDTSFSSIAQCGNRDHLTVRDQLESVGFVAAAALGFLPRGSTIEQKKSMVRDTRCCRLYAYFRILPRSLVEPMGSISYQTEMSLRRALTG